ncbi:LOB domain-containing protein 36-like [Aristolochia californica]|uniref:LOB domain-containing protein 36-like n=1 Tax=Aristolochia californica TaxID=171875 RepID=UPI0035D56B46
MASSSNSPCAACKFLRRKCTQECVFAPYFPPDHPQKFAHVHKVFGASNVSKLLNDLIPTQREDAVNSLAYEAEARLRDPVYGCVGLISLLQHRLKQVQNDLYNAKKELSTFVGQSGVPMSHPHHMLPQAHQAHQSNSMGEQYGMPSFGLTIPIPRASQTQAQFLMREQQQMFDSQQLAVALAAREQQEMMRNYGQQQQQQELVRFNGGFDGGGEGPASTGFSQMNAASPSSMSLVASPSSAALVPFENPFQVQQQDQEQQQHPHLRQQQHPHPHHPHHQRAGSKDGNSVGPSS